MENKPTLQEWEKRFKDNRSVLVWNGVPDSIRESKLLCFFDLELWLQKESIHKDIQDCLYSELERYRSSPDETNETYLHHKGKIDGLSLALRILNFREIKLIECVNHGGSIADKNGRCRMCDSIEIKPLYEEI